MALKIHEYPIESLTFGDDDFYDIDFFDGINYQTRKIKGSTIKAGIQSVMQNLYNSDGTLTGDRTLTGDNFLLFFQELGQFIVHSHKNNVDNVIFEVRSQSGFDSFVIKDHMTNDPLIRVTDGKVEITNSYFLPTLDGNAGDVMTTDGAGNVTFQPITITNIYNSNGTLISNRFVNIDEFFLQFEGFESISGANNIFRLAYNEIYGLVANALSQNSGISITDAFSQLFHNEGAVNKRIRVDQNGFQVNGAYYLPNTDGTNGQVLTTDGAGNVTFQTPTSGGIEKKIDSFYAFDMSQAGGFTWNGIANVGATALVTLNERTRLQAFAGAGSPDGCFVNSILPSYYVSGNTIRVDLVVTENGTGGNIKYFVGLNRPTTGNAFGGAVVTEWLTSVHTASAGFNITKISLTFAGTDLSAGEPIAILVFRDPGDAQDTFNGDSYLNTISVEQS